MSFSNVYIGIRSVSTDYEPQISVSYREWEKVDRSIPTLECWNYNPADAYGDCSDYQTAVLLHISHFWPILRFPKWFTTISWTLVETFLWHLNWKSSLNHTLRTDPLNLLGNWKQNYYSPLTVKQNGLRKTSQPISFHSPLATISKQPSPLPLLSGCPVGQFL